MQSTLTLEQRDERDAQQRADFLARPGSIPPQKKARTPMPEEYHRRQKCAVRLGKKLGYFSDSPTPMFKEAESWIAIIERGKDITYTYGAEIAGLMKANERKARELAKQAKAAPIPRERALVVIS